MSKRIECEEKNTTDAVDDDEEEEIIEELEGASNSLNLAEIDKLPQLTQTSNKKSTGTKGSTELKGRKEVIDDKDLVDTEAVAPILREKTYVKESPRKTKNGKGMRRSEKNETDEDLVVLSFSNHSSK